jgi:C1A family cysteine protease
MKRYRTPFIIALILFFVGIPILLSAADQRITSPGVAFDYKARELKAPPHIASKLTQLRSQIATQKLSFKVGYTAAMDFDLAKIAVLKVPTNLAKQISAQNALAVKRLKELPKMTPIVTTCSSTGSRFDWRPLGAVTPVKDQGGCGSCWDFATIGAFEGSWRIVNKETIDASEQDVLDCSRMGDCTWGGWIAFQYLVQNGVATEASYPYHSTGGTCLTPMPRPYRADTWGYLGNDINIPSVAALKHALCIYGPLYVSVRATDAFQAYVSGVFDEHASGPVNHGVTLIGWDDSKKAWLIKNSWGTGWGDVCGYGAERGYMWISYTSNSIGFGAAWVRAQAKMMALKSMANGKYVSAGNGGAAALVANSMAVGLSETFEVVNLGPFKIALKSMANGKFVSVDNGTAKSLIANLSTVQPGAIFSMGHLPNGEVILNSTANGKYVIAGNGGAAPLVANWPALPLQLRPEMTFQIVNASR